LPDESGDASISASIILTFPSSVLMKLPSNLSRETVEPVAVKRDNLSGRITVMSATVQLIYSCYNPAIIEVHF